MAKHTPGPWRIEDDCVIMGELDGKPAQILMAAETTALDNREWTRRLRDQRPANLALAAAAPAMMEALEAAKDALNSLPVDVLGFGRDGEECWPIRDELIYNLTTALAAARQEQEQV